MLDEVLENLSINYFNDDNLELEPDLVDLGLGWEVLKQNFDVYSISYFDHVLSEDEFVNTLFICYQDAKKLDLLTDMEEILNRFLLFFHELFLLNNGITIIYGIYGLNPIKLSHHYSLYRRLVIDGLKEQSLCAIFFQNLDITIDMGFDLTHHIYIKKGNTDIMDTLSPLIKNKRLHFI